jgi:hypothetical protein
MEGVGGAKVVKGAGDRASIGAGEIGGIRMDSQDHVGSPIDLATVRMAETKLRRRLRRERVARVGAACSEARAKVTVRMRASTLRP